ncbi:uncharacterized protein [Linepithema humile]|uniref:uncharacterized protein isoform X2 n=1 Tax=Linepithema humile TaxID=83485 RepID=UPI00351E5236
MLELSSEMEFPEDQYYRLNYILLSVIGLWPYDNFKVRQFRFFLVTLIVISLTAALLMKLFFSENNLGPILKILSIYANFTLIFAKYITFYAITENVKEFRKRIRNNWYSLIDNREIEIIRKQANTGKSFTMFILMSVYFSIFFYISTQYFSILLDMVKPLNETRPRKLILLTEYFIDQEKYFHIIAIHISTGVVVVLTILIATESFCFANALHAFGLFKVASYRMEHILSEIDPQMCSTEKFIISRDKIIAAVDFHRRAIEFSKLLQATFGPAYLSVFVIGVFSASISLYNMSQILMTEDEVLEIIKYTTMLALPIIYLTVGNFVGQEFIDCDMHFYHTICSTPWYIAPLKTQSLILFLIQKTTKSYKVDAGGLFSPSLEGLATSLSMIISYFMVLHSTQL